MTRRRAELGDWTDLRHNRGMTLSIDAADVPAFDISDPFFSASSDAVARAA